MNRHEAIRVKATDGQREQVPRGPGLRDHAKRPGLAQGELEPDGVQRVDDDAGVLGGVLRADLLVAALVAALVQRGNPDALGGDMDVVIRPRGRRRAHVAGRPRLGDGEDEASPQGVVEIPPRHGVELEGPNLPDDGAVQSVVRVGGGRLHDNVRADVVGGDLVHVRRDARDVDDEIVHPPLPPALQGHRQAAGRALGGRNKHAGPRLEEAAAFHLEGEVVVAVSADGAEQVGIVWLALVARKELLRDVLQGSPQLLQALQARLV
mmetsp:Transcript_23662/g.67948  ORF Transcript_23662/g.67948 Transcript_23662/m.67948 type:complete len:265 (-) Transcript_23662:170-964(-)